MVAVTVTVWKAAMVEGAVYKPEGLIDPALAGVNVHTTLGLAGSATVAVNC